MLKTTKYYEFIDLKQNSSYSFSNYLTSRVQISPTSTKITLKKLYFSPVNFEQIRFIPLKSQGTIGEEIEFVKITRTCLEAT